MHIISLLRREFDRLSRDADSHAQSETALDQWQRGNRLTRRACAFFEAESRALYPALVALQSEPPRALMRHHLGLLRLARSAESLLQARDVAADCAVRELAQKLATYAEQHEQTLWPRLLGLMVEAELMQVGGEMLMALAANRVEAASPVRRLPFGALLRALSWPVGTMRRVASPTLSKNLPVLLDVIAGAGGGGAYNRNRQPTRLALA